MKKFLIVFLVLWTGCAPTLSHRQIRELGPTVEIIDGIDKAEAIILAQNFLLRNGLYDRLVSLQPYRVKREVIWLKDGQEIEYVIAPRDREGIAVRRTWILYFKDKNNSWFGGLFPLVPFRVIVDADTAEVINWGLDKLGEQ